MSSPRAKKMPLLLTHRALSDISDIHEFSVATWGSKAAARYLDDIQSALDLIKEHPGVLQSEAGFHDSLKFYSVNKHVVVCDQQPDAVIVLTLLHGSLDIPSRLSELIPSLVIETELLHRKLKTSRKKKPSS